MTPSKAPTITTMTRAKTSMAPAPTALATSAMPWVASKTLFMATTHATLTPAATLALSSKWTAKLSSSTKPTPQQRKSCTTRWKNNLLKLTETTRSKHSRITRTPARVFVCFCCDLWYNDYATHYTHNGIFVSFVRVLR